MSQSKNSLIDVNAEYCNIHYKRYLFSYHRRWPVVDVYDGSNIQIILGSVYDTTYDHSDLDKIFSKEFIQYIQIWLSSLIDSISLDDYLRAWEE